VEKGSPFASLEELVIEELPEPETEEIGALVAPEVPEEEALAEDKESALEEALPPPQLAKVMRANPVKRTARFFRIVFSSWK